MPLYLLIILNSRIETLSSLLLKVLVCYDVTPCRLVNIYVLFKSLRSSRGSGSRRPLTEETCFQYQSTAFGVFGERRRTGTGFPPNTSVFSFDIIPLVLGYHVFIYNRRCINSAVDSVVK